MIRILALLAVLALAGCVITPDYAYRGGPGSYYGDSGGYYYDDADNYPYSGVYLGDYYADLGGDSWWPYWSTYPMGGYPYTAAWPYSYPITWYGAAAYGYPVGLWGSRLWLSWNAPGYWWSASNYWWTYPNYYWVTENPPRPDRFRDSLYAEKVRHVPLRRGVVGAAGGSLLSGSSQSLRRDAVHRERARQVWHRPWPGRDTSIDRDTSYRAPVVRRDARRQPLSQPVNLPRGEPSSRPANGHRVIRRARPQHIDPIAVPRDLSATHRRTPRPTVIRRAPSRPPTRSVSPPAPHHAPSPTVVRSVSMPSRASSPSSSVSHASPRGAPRSSAGSRDD